SADDAETAEKDVAAFGIGSVKRIAGFRKQSHRVKIAPAFAHRPRHICRKPAAVSMQAVRGAVCHFVIDDLNVGRAVPVRVRTRKNVHLHTSAVAVRRRAEISVVRAAEILACAETRSFWTPPRPKLLCRKFRAGSVNPSL